MTTGVGDKQPTMMVSPDPQTVDELSESVHQHLGKLVTDRDVPLLVRTILDEMTPLTVRTYLPVLVERRIREQLDTRAPSAA